MAITVLKTSSKKNPSHMLAIYRERMADAPARIRDEEASRALCKVEGRGLVLGVVPF